MIQQIRTDSGLTIRQLADIFHVSRQMVHRWLAGEGYRMAHREHVLEVGVLIQEAKERLGSSSAVCDFLLTPSFPGGKKPITYLAEKRYDVFCGFLLHERTGRESIVPLQPSGRVYRERPREEIEDALHRLRPPAFPEDDEDEVYWAIGFTL